MILDILIVAILLLAAFSGSRSGFLRRFGAGIGFIGGLFIGRWLGPQVLFVANAPDQRALVAVSVLLTCALLCLAIGEYLGSLGKQRLTQTHFQQVNKADNALGGALSVVVIIISLWLLSGVLSTLPSNGLKGLLQDSRLMSSITQLLPPVPHSITNLSYLIDPNSFPDVFLDNEPIPSGKVALPELGAFESVVNNTKNSVVRIKGQGCGGIVSGSGFVAGQDLVVTNAHVVAGISQPYVQDPGGNHRATTIWFDPDLDLAILRTQDLVGPVLPLSDETIKNGTEAVVVGYPDGGEFKALPAAVLRKLNAKGRDIYNQGKTLREIYELQADIVHGNSGGPVINKQGQVVGVVFAESTTYEELGYALTNSKVSTAVLQAADKTQTVSTGKCAE